LANEHDLEPADIESIAIFGVGVNSGMTGVPWTSRNNPHVLAQFCAPYEVASVLKNRRFGPAEITNGRIAEDKEVDALARRVRLCHWDEWGGPRPAQQAVRIFLKEGRTLEAWRQRDEVLHPNANPYEKLVEKFTYNVTFSGLVEEERVDRLVHTFEHLDECENVGEFVRQFLAYEK
jgi:2-methylcitrate dehydratase PrpD